MFTGILCLLAAYGLIRYRLKVVEVFGKVEWAEYYLGRGGTYNLVVIIAVLLFIWGLASITGTLPLLLSPLGGLRAGV